MDLLLDVRSREDFEVEHVLHAYNIDWNEMKDRGFELPPRSERLTVCCKTDMVQYIRDWFSTRSKRCLWNVTVIGYDELVAQSGSVVCTGPSPPGLFLFPASPLLRQSLPLLVEMQRKMVGRPSVKLRALDIGCGSGRDAIILATSGFFTTGIDRDPRALERWLRLSERQGCRARCTAVTADLHCPGDLQIALENDEHTLKTFHVILVCRHLHRPLSELTSLLAPEGLLLIHTFMEGNHHPVDSASVLCYGELARAFGRGDSGSSTYSSISDEIDFKADPIESAANMEILRDEALAIEDGRILSFFVARCKH